MMTYLPLAKKEIDVLKKAIAVRLHELQQEIIRAETGVSQHELKNECECLEHIDTQLKEPEYSRTG